MKSVTARDAQRLRRLFSRLCGPAKQPRIARLARIFSLPSKTMQLASRKRCPSHGHLPSKYYPALRFRETIPIIYLPSFHTPIAARLPSIRIVLKIHQLQTLYMVRKEGRLKIRSSEIEEHSVII